MQLLIAEPSACGPRAVGLEASDFADLALGFCLLAGREVLADVFAVEPD